MYSTKEAADKLGLSPDHVRLLSRKGIIKAQKVWRDWELALSEIEGIEQRTKELLKGMEFDLPLESAGFIFIVGIG